MCTIYLLKDSHNGSFSRVFWNLVASSQLDESPVTKLRACTQKFMDNSRSGGAIIVIAMGPIISMCNCFVSK
jgi:hypothetical protein